MNYYERQAELAARVARINQTALWYKTSSLKILEGWACLYNVVHEYKGRKELFEKGCFDGSLFGVMFKLDHDLLSKKLGDQDDGNLELIDNAIGLSFRLKLAPGDLERLGGRDAMSVQYLEHDVETQMVGGAVVRVIKTASLIEISAVFVGAVKQTFAAVRNASTVGLLKDDVANFAHDAAGMDVSRAFRRLMSTLE